MIEAHKVPHRAGALSPEILHQALRFFDGPVQHVDCRSAFEQAEHDTPCRTPGAKHDRTLSGECRFTLKRPVRPHPVGVAPDQASVAQRHRVDRANLLGTRVDFIEKRHHLDLVGHGNCELLEPKGAYARDRLRELFGWDIEGHVASVDVHLAKRRVMHQRRFRVSSRVEDDAAQSGLGCDQLRHGSRLSSF